MIKASIITIGDELLIGQVVDTNSAWIATQLNKIGVRICRRVSVGDNYEDIWNAIDEEKRNADIILLTGGLGPTSDDITKPILCKYFGGKLVVDQEALKNVKYLFEQVFKRAVTDVNLKQAEVPESCTVIQNKRGTAPGMWFEKDNLILISMPGVPYEMKGILEEAMLKIKDRFTLPVIMHKTLITSGIGESAISDKIKDFERDLPKHIRLAYLPDYGFVRLRLSSEGFDEKALASEVDEQFKLLADRVKEHLVTCRDEPMETVVGNLLIERNKSMATAESCTGGYIAHLITSHDGASRYFKGSVVCYDNSVKENFLKVPRDLLDQYGAVSAQVVRQMLQGVLINTGSDYGIAVSGIMGPSGGSPEKTIGTVWIAAGTIKNAQVRKLSLRFDRLKNIQVTAKLSLDLLRSVILAD